MASVFFLVSVLTASLFTAPVDGFGLQGRFHRASSSRSARRPGSLDLSEAATSAPSSAAAEFATLPVDHFGEHCSWTFQNRYFVNDRFYQPGGPIVVLDWGESGLGKVNWDWFLHETNDYFHDVLEQFHGMGIFWEHRFYGASSPVRLSSNTKPSDLQYQTVEQALADVATFAADFSRPDRPDVDLTPASTPWVFMGGSYSGYRAALMRERYPNTIQSAWAASAPVKYHIDMSVYFLPILQGMQDLGWSNCSADIGAAVQRMDGLLEDKTSAAELKQSFLGPGAEKFTNSDFMKTFWTLLNNWQANMFGTSEDDPNPQFTIANFCDWIETDPSSGRTAPAQGWAASRGVQYVIDRWRNWKPYLTEVNLSADCLGPHANGSRPSTNCYWTVYTSDEPDGIAWLWQMCSQFGNFQVHGPELHHLVSRWNSIEYQKTTCQLMFPDAIAQGFMPAMPQPDVLDREFNGYNINPSNVYWTDGQYDPWRTESRLSDLPDVPHPRRTRTPPKCNVSPPSDEIFGVVLPNSAHLYEFGFEPAALDAQQLWLRALREWLPCFETKSPEEIRPRTCGTTHLADPSAGASPSATETGSGPAATSDDSSVAALIRPEVVSFVLPLCGLILLWGWGI